VQLQLTTVPGIKNKLFGGDGLFLAELTGPGKVVLQSLTLARLAHALAPCLPASEGSGSGNGVSLGGIAGGLLSGGN
jgi:uncharacterized protein (AIM24 family)